MRFLIASLILGCCTVCYAQETTQESPVEVTTNEDGSGEDDGDVTVNVESSKEKIDNDCGCGKKDHKPKV